MPKLIAIHEVVRGSGAKRETFAPKAEFDATEAEAKELLAAGAAKVVEVAEAPKKSKKQEDDVI